MKALFLWSVAIVLLVTSCEVHDHEPRYDSRDRMVGYYTFDEYSNTYHDYVHYTVRVSKDLHHGSEIYFSNFYGADITVYAYVEYDRITIPFQVVRGFEVEGTGVYRDGALYLDYSVNDLYSDSYTDFCETVAYREY